MLGVWVTLRTPEPLCGTGGMLWGIWLSSAPPQTPLPGLEPRDGLQRFHSLSVSSDATMDSFASLLPDEVMWGRGWGWRAMERVLSPAVPAARRAACQGPGAAALAAQHRLAGRLTH